MRPENRGGARPVGLAVRLQRGSLVAWGLGLTAFGAAFGSLVGEVEVFLAENPQLQDVFAAGTDGALVEAFLSTVLLLLGLLAAGLGITAALRLSREEAAGRAEALLATAVPRARWAGSHLVVALGGAALVLLAAAGGIGVAAALTLGDGAWVGDLLVAGVAHVPAVWLVVAVVMALYGLTPRAAGWGWLLLVHAAAVGLMGDLLDLPEGARALSPFHHVGDVLGDGVGPAPLVTAAVTAGLVALGLTAFRRRDLATAA